MSTLRRLLSIGCALVAVALALALAPAAPAAPAAEPKTSLSDIEDEVMCVICGVPLNLTESAPQAERERALIQDLIDQGKTKDEIKAALVAEYGEQVLADPPGGGFNVAVWLVPALLVVGLIGAALVLLPRWRRREAAATAAPSLPALDDADARRIDEELARYR